MSTQSDRFSSDINATRHARVASRWAVLARYCALGAVALGVAVLGAGAVAQSRKPAPATTQLQAPLFDPKDAVIILLDHQTGLFQTVKDVPLQELRTNTTVLARLATVAGIPVITTASEPGGPNGPLMPEIHEAAPSATYVGRKGEVSAWDNPDFVRTVRATGRKTLILAGVWTSVCVAFPALQAKAEGYNVYAVMDASGDLSVMASQASMHRMAQAGVVPVSTNVVVTEVQRTWNRPDADKYGALYSEFAPHYRAAIESHKRAQEAVTARK
jgi:nicotinamidase-related amidase